MVGDDGRRPVTRHQGDRKSDQLFQRGPYPIGLGEIAGDGGEDLRGGPYLETARFHPPILPADSELEADSRDPKSPAPQERSVGTS